MMNVAQTTSSRGDTTTNGVVESGTALWQNIALAAILLLSAFLNLYQLARNGFADTNTYYAAAVKSMLLNWHNFFFVAFDPAGFLSIDKPPLGFWLQVLSARIFGLSGWSLLLPEALAGIASVALLFVLVRRVFGANAGLLSALALAVTPISVVTSRDNTIDSLLTLTLLLGAWTICLAVETGRLRYLLLTALIVGLGFNIKMLEAYVILPAFALTYLLCAPVRWHTRLLHLLLATIVLLLVSLSWIAVVDAVPAGQRPYVASTQSDSELELALGYNGFSRILGVGTATHTQTGTAHGTTNTAGIVILFGIVNTGLPSPLRLVGALLGGQIGWLIPFALLGLICTVKRRGAEQVNSRRRTGLILWGIWFVTLFLFFSAALFPHAYYMVTFAPAICALFGIGCVEMYQQYHLKNGWRGWLLPIALVLTALTQLYIYNHTVTGGEFEQWSHWLLLALMVLCVLLAIVLIAARFIDVTIRLPRVSSITALVTLALLCLLVFPTIWSAFPLTIATDPANPTAGPKQPENFLTIIVHAFIPENAEPQPELTNYLLAHQGQSRYLVAAVNAPTVAAFILNTDKPAMALGGYNSFDPILTASQVATMVRDGEVRFFLFPSFAHIDLSHVPPQLVKSLKGFNSKYNGKDNKGETLIQGDISQWVTTHCALVPRSVAEPGIAGPSDTVDIGDNQSIPTQLFDCAQVR